MAAYMQNVLIVEQLAHIQAQQPQDDQVIVSILKRSERKEGRGDARSGLRQTWREESNSVTITG